MQIMNKLQYIPYFIDIIKGRKGCKAPDSIPLINLHITERCNCRCRMCDIWNFTACTKELSTDEITELIDDAKDMGTLIISLGGGEPLLREDIFEIIRKIN